MPRKFLQNSAGNFVAALGRLIWVRGGAERDRFIRLNAAQFMAQQVGGVLFHVNLLLESHTVAHLHKFVRVAGVAVAASEFASTIGVDRPSEGHLPLADTAI